MRSVQDIRTINKLLTGAEAEAHRAGESLPGAEHLLLSALALPDGSARRVFARLGADPDELRAAIAAQHAAALRAIGVEPADPADEEALDTAVAANAPAAKGVFRANAPAQEAFRAAVQLARTPPSPLLGAHVVAAVARIEHGTAPRAVRGMNIDPDTLAAAARDELDSEQAAR